MKRTKKDRKKVFDEKSWGNNHRNERRRRTKKSARGGRTSTPDQLQSQNQDTVTSSINHSEVQPAQNCTSIPVSMTEKADAQTQTRCNTKHANTQTESISHQSCHTQTESDPKCEATVQVQENSYNDSPKMNKEKTDSGATVSDPGGEKKKDTPTPSNCDAVMQEEDVKTKKEGQGEQDSSKSTDTIKSYAEAASCKDLKDENNQTVAGQKAKTQPDKAVQR